MATQARGFLLGSLVLLAGAAGGCSTTSPAARTSAPASQSGAYGGGDGSSCAKRVIVHADNERVGAELETEWLLKHFPLHERESQALEKCDERPVDVIRIIANGQPHNVYFDIFEFYGHF